MSEPEKRTYESQMKFSPGLRLVAQTPQSPSELRGSRRPEESHQSITLHTARVKADPAQVEKIDLLYRLINYIKTL
jgi:hypothetical protein